jgi:uncharacterized repeat protein (TIGR02543 family)
LGLTGLNDIGADYALDVSSSQAYLYKWIGEYPWFEPVSSLPVNLNRSYFSLAIPLSAIDDDGILDYALWDYGNNDIVPDNGHGTTKALADWLSVSPVSGTVDPDDQTETAVTINATGLEIGEYIGYVVIMSNDLDESVTYVPVNLAVYLPIQGSIDFEPDLIKLNPKAKGGFVEAYIELPEGFDAQQIDISSIRLNGTVSALPKPTKLGDHDRDGVPDLMVRFSRAAVESLLTPGGQVQITIAGQVAGIGFRGTDTIQVIDPTGRSLTISSTAGGAVTTPGQGPFTYKPGTVVNLVASPAGGYRFVNWTGDVGTVANVSAAATTITMKGDYSITANFAPIPPLQYTLTMAVTGSGATIPAVGEHTYSAGTVVPIIAAAAAGYQFVNWTAPAGSFANASSATTIFTMPAQNVTVTANFAPIPPPLYSLTISSTAGGAVTTPGQGTFTYGAGTLVNLVAAAAGGYRFVNWTGNVGTVANVTAAATTVTMNGNYSIVANFAVVPPV